MAILSIEKEQTIFDVKRQFSTIFPYLKIEFFSEPHIAGQLSPRSKQLGATTRISHIQNSKAGKLMADENLTVQEFENLMEDNFGLHVQVFRKSGTIWLETSATDSWTLARQNEEGKSLQQHFKVKLEDPEEHDFY